VAEAVQLCLSAHVQVLANVGLLNVTQSGVGVDDDLIDTKIAI
jgi:hypothetical protein